MSVIENALQKLRQRSGPGGGAGSRGAILRTPPEGARPAAPPVTVAARPSGAHEAPARRIAVDLTSLRRLGYLASDEQRRRVADEYRKIKRPLIEQAFAKEAAPEMRLVLISSPLPGDGKTFTTINLALSMARERDLSVLLIDADAAKGQVSEVFGVRKEPGLIDALLNESLDVESLIVRTDVPGLELLPAGRQVENATELLASARMAQIAARLTTHSARRIALIDSSPLLASSEAGSLLRVPGQIVLVVRASVTPRHAVFEALAHIDERKLRGLIFNQARLPRGEGYYYYGYGDQGSVGSDKPAD